MEQKTVAKSGPSQPAKMPSPTVAPAKVKDHWFVEVVSGYTLAVWMVSALTMLHVLMTVSVFA